MLTLTVERLQHDPVHWLTQLFILFSLLLRCVDRHGMQEIDLMINEIDKNNDGEIDFGEFVAVMSRKVQATYTAEEVKNAFKVSEFAAVSLAVARTALPAASPL